MLIQNGDKLINTRNWSELVRPEQLVRDPKSTDMYGKFVCEPLERGFATTIGNSLRRVLLSSLQGAAIVAAHIEGVQHEFTTVKGVLEDVTEIVLNLKQVRLAMTSVEPQKLVLEAKKKGPVTAGNIKENQNVRVLNPEQHIATLSEDREFRMEIEIRMGKGYVPSEMHEGLEDEIGLITLDASFSPVRKVAYMVEQARVGQMTNYDKLLLEVWTDGSLSPEDAVAYSAKILKEQLTIFINFPEEPEPEHIEISEEPSLNENLFRTVDELELSVRLSLIHI
jgi:DNA-directed RNA polymerase subunit alpha